jgi:hypothetical protein
LTLSSKPEWTCKMYQFFAMNMFFNQKGSNDKTVQYHSSDREYNKLIQQGRNQFTKQKINGSKINRSDHG